MADAKMRARLVAVRAAPWRGRCVGVPRRGIAALGPYRWRCAIGRAQIAALKREGDGATPVGRFDLWQVMFRSDRGRRPSSRLPVRAIDPADGWCDAPGDRNYNRFVRHPYPHSAERLWRDDQLYDVVVVTRHNQRPRIQGLGSAVFLHVAQPGLAPTEGCVAFRAEELRWLLRAVGSSCRLVVIP